MRHTPLLRHALTGTALRFPALALLALAIPAGAQDQGGTVTSFGVSEKLSALNGASGTAISGTTGLSFSTRSTTPEDTLSFDGGLGLVLTRNPDGSTDAQVTTPNLGLSYDRTTAASAFNLDLSYARDQIDTVRPLSDFINSDGVLVPPSNPGDLVGTGLKESANLSLGVEMGRNAPFGLTLSANAGKTVYTTSDPTLLDTSSAGAGATGRFSYSSAGRVTLGVDRTSTTTDTLPDQTTTTVSLGTGYDVSPVLSLNAGLDYRLTDQAGSGTSRATSPTFGASYKLKTGSLAFDASDTTASLTWQQQTATASFAASLSHGPGANGDGRIDTLGLNYSQSIDAVSSLAVGAYYSDQADPVATLTGTSLSLSYNHALNQDWGLSTGMTYKLRDEAGVGTTHSTGLFLTVSRSFDARH